MSDSHTPLPNPSAEELDAPKAPYLNDRASTSGSPAPSNNSYPLLNSKEREANENWENNEPEAAADSAPTRRRPKWLWFLVGAAALVVLVLVIVLPVYFTVVKPKKNNSSDGTGDSNDGGGGDDSPSTPSTPITGGDGSEVIMSNGTKFTYNNKFGGFWVSDPNNPYSMNAQPNEWTKPLNESWEYGKDKIYGVNIGGWFVLEPFISPAIFQAYPDAVDEWTLSTAMRADKENGGINQLEDHYNTFITEQDIAEIAGAGLNWIRLPIPFWAIDVWDDEPFLEKTAWKYILQTFEWCRKYGIRINLDFHAVPGSQNAFNHSGKLGKINFLNGVMGIANAQRMLNYIRIITEFISQPQYQGLVPIFSVLNEPVMTTIGKDQLYGFYIEVHKMIREITGYGEGHGPYIALHDSFMGLDSWHGFLENSDRIIIDTHPYLSFGGGPNAEPIATGTGNDAGGQWPGLACDQWAAGINNSMNDFGMTISGEFSSGYNDCGLFLKGINDDANNPDCEDLWNDYTTWNKTIKAGVEAFSSASIDAFQNWFYWTWKIGEAKSGRVEAPLWSYKLGYENGWIEKDPRKNYGKCTDINHGKNQWKGSFEPWQTGGKGAGSIAASSTEQYPWPPASINNVDAPASLLPTYTLTGSVATLTPMPVSASGVDAGNGWYNTADTTRGPATVDGCSYAPAWDALDRPAPTAAC